MIPLSGHYKQRCKTRSFSQYTASLSCRPVSNSASASTLEDGRHSETFCLYLFINLRFCSDSHSPSLFCLYKACLRNGRFFLFDVDHFTEAVAFFGLTAFTFNCSLPPTSIVADFLLNAIFAGFIIFAPAVIVSLYTVPPNIIITRMNANTLFHQFPHIHSPLLIYNSILN